MKSVRPEPTGRNHATATHDCPGGLVVSAALIGVLGVDAHGENVLNVLPHFRGAAFNFHFLSHGYGTRHVYCRGLKADNLVDESRIKADEVVAILVARSYQPIVMSIILLRVIGDAWGLRQIEGVFGPPAGVRVRACVGWIDFIHVEPIPAVAVLIAYGSLKTDQRSRIHVHRTHFLVGDGAALSEGGIG
jgi:hypothetical protein